MACFILLSACSLNTRLLYQPNEGVPPGDTANGSVVVNENGNFTPQSDYDRIVNTIEKSKSCKTKSDCTAFYGECPFACHIVINNSSEAEIKQSMASFRAQQGTNLCQYRCQAIPEYDCIQDTCQFVEKQENKNTNVNPEETLRACTMEAKLCPDGSYVGRTGPNCEFAECPSGTSAQVNINATIEVDPPLRGCTKELKICPDGTGVGRTGPNCEFEKCPGEK